jgi:hypothetical protein
MWDLETNLSCFLRNPDKIGESQASKLGDARVGKRSDQHPMVDRRDEVTYSLAWRFGFPLFCLLFENKNRLFFHSIGA